VKLNLSRRDEIVQTLNVLFKRSAVLELRALNTNQGTVSGYYNDFEKLADDAIALERQATGIYVTANVCKPELLARSVNHTTAYAKITTGDHDIIARRWLLIDIDPVRPSGISSSEVEHDSALVRAHEVKQWLGSQGWPEPIEADSGNGAYLLYRIELPNSPASQSLIKSCLEALSFQFSDDMVMIDTGVGNAGRLMRLFGTSNRKGDPLDHRPHRVSRLLQVPPSLVVVPDRLLDDLAVFIPATPSGDNHQSDGFDVPAWLSAHSLEIFKTKTWNGATVYELQKCPFDAKHDRAPSVIQFKNGALAFHCFHGSCKGYKWADLRLLMEPHQGHDIGDWSEMAHETPVWPTLAPEAFYGLPGEFVKTVSPFSEADPVAILLHMLTAAGNQVGPGPYVEVEHAKHCARLNILCIGRTANSRKGTSWNLPKLILSRIDPPWADRVKSGLSSGEGLIYQVRNPVYEPRPMKNKDGSTTYEMEMVDVGVADKRLLVIEQEFATALKRMDQNGNTLSPVQRDAWDHGDLSTLTKREGLVASGAHISVIGHITQDELLRYLTETERANGLANRFLFLLLKRGQLIPSGKGVPPEVLIPFNDRFSTTIQLACKRGRLGRDIEAEALWAEMYPALEEEIPGMTGAILARGAAQVLRLSLHFALLDEEEMKKNDAAIRTGHLMAAFAIWQYCKASVFTIFGDAVGDPVADRLLVAIKSGPKTDTDLYEALGKHSRDRYRKDHALDLLHRLHRVHTMKERTLGRSVRWWHYGQSHQCALCATSAARS
jgi:hypothetical protein